MIRAPLNSFLQNSLQKHWIWIGLILSFAGLLVAHRLAPPLHCPNDEFRYVALVELGSANPIRLLQIRPTRDVRTPMPEEIDHQLFVAGPKLLAFVSGIAMFKLLNLFGDYSALQALYILNWVLIVALIAIIALKFFPRIQGTEVAKIGFMVTTATLVPLIAQHEFFTTYNPLFGILIVSLFLTIQKDSNVHLILGGVLCWAMLLVSPASPLFCAAYALSQLVFSKRKFMSVLIPVLSFAVLTLATEAMYRLAGNSFFYLFYRHIFNNVAQNQMSMVFPYFPAIPLAYLWRYSLPLLVGATSIAIVAFFPSLRRRLNPWQRQMIFILFSWTIAYELLPTIPLGRTMYAFWISIICIVPTLPFFSIQTRWKTSAVLGIMVALNFVQLRGPLYSFCAFEQEGPLYEFLTQSPKWKALEANQVFLKKPQSPKFTQYTGE